MDQEVYMLSGVYIKKGRVVKVTPDGVDVLVGELLHFDTYGCSYVTLWDRMKMAILSPQRWRGNGTYECGPWYIDDMPFAERTALMEQARRDYEATRSEANRRPPR